MEKKNYLGKCIKKTSENFLECTDLLNKGDIMSRLIPSGSLRYV